jgi:hypothetical protein
MTIFFVIVSSVFLVVVTLQYMIIRLMLPRGFSKIVRMVISFVVTVAINTIPFLYMNTERIFDKLSWWHRELVVFPYAIFMVASAFTGVLILIMWPARSMLLRLRPRFDKTKRDFFANAARTLIGTSVGALAYGTYHEIRAVEISRLTLPYSRLHPDLCGFKVVHVTDIHAGPFISFEMIADVVSRANALKPDLIVLTGDYVNHHTGYIAGCVGLIDELKAPAGVFGVYGNHDYYTGIEAMIEAFSKTGISMLRDSCSGAKGLEGLLNIIGVDDPVHGWATDARFEDFSRVLPLAQPDQFNLLLSHRPGIFRLHENWNVDLTLAGHTHGGQAIVPWVGGRGLSLAGLFLTYTHGLYESENNPEVRMYVNRGIGTIVAPVRLFCKPEIVEITLTK